MIYDKNNINEGYFQSVSASCRCIFKEFAAVRILHILVNINLSFQSFSDCIFFLQLPKSKLIRWWLCWMWLQSFKSGKHWILHNLKIFGLFGWPRYLSSLPLYYSNLLRMWFDFLMVFTKLIKIRVYVPNYQVCN